MKRALPASLAVIVGACLCMLAGSLFAFDVATLSTMCLVSRASVGCCLIWRISQPFTTVRTVLFASIVADGALPRKTFSLGEAHDKRYYLEARAIR